MSLIRNIEKDLLAQKEDRKECKCSCHQINPVAFACTECQKNHPTPSPQEESKYIEFEEIKEPSHPQGNPNEKYYMEYIGDCIKYAAKIVVNSLTNKKV